MTWRPVDLDPVALIMVGKPARGKTFTARRIARYTGWLGYHAKVFNVGSYRRERLGHGQPHSFFDPDNPDGRKARKAMAVAAVTDLVKWLKTGGEVGILDATNSTKARRAWVAEACAREGIDVVYVEVTCDDRAVVERNVRETKVLSPDYAGRDAEESVRDFFARIAHYERAYEPVQESEGSFIRIVDLGRRIELQGVHGFLPGRLITFLMHLHDTKRPIYLSRHGESLFNVRGRIGGDSALSPLGEDYARRLGAWVEREVPREQPLTVWTSTLKRTILTSKPIGRPARSWKLLDEIDGGICDGLTYGEIEERYPGEFAKRGEDKFRYRYPQGESYQDVIARVEPVILELERHQHPVLVIAHQAVIRTLLSYLTGSDPEKCPHDDVPLHTVIKVVPGPYGSLDTRVPLGP